MLPSLLGFTTAAAAARAGLGGVGGLAADRQIGSAAAAAPQQHQQIASGYAPAAGGMTAAAAANIVRQPQFAAAAMQQQPHRLEGVATAPAMVAGGVSDMAAAAAAAAVGAGALSAVPYGAASALQLPLISGLPDGSLDVSLMPSSAIPPRDISPVGRRSGSDASGVPLRNSGAGVAQGYSLRAGGVADGVGVGQVVVAGRSFRGLEEEPERSSDHSQGQRSDHTDDTDQVGYLIAILRCPDSAGTSPYVPSTHT